jgi:hypothetical protein
MQGGDMALLDYIRGVHKTVNCYDQAGAIQALCGAVGVAITWVYLEPYGYIKPTQLIGVGGGADCNNPFFMSNGSRRLMVGFDRDWEQKGISLYDPYLRFLLENQWPDRTSFGNHAFGAIGYNIYDACAGPHTGSESGAQYCANAIDTTTTIYSYKKWIKFGTSKQIYSGGGVGTVS